MPAGLNLLVFRDARNRVSGPELKAGLLRRLDCVCRRSSSEELLDALLLAGELECAVSDSATTPLEPYSTLTDRLAEALLVPDLSPDWIRLRAAFAQAATPDVLEVSPPEGFAYYALHPLAYADAVAELKALGAGVAVLGIRTIGVTLSAVAAAAARARGLAAERITVRPHAHPYNRATSLSSDQAEFVRSHADRGASFLVVDEGPGLSGSTFISVAEALLEAGAPRDRITLLCGHEPDFDSLRTDEGPSRARGFRWIAVATEPRRPPAAEVFIGAGQWRRHLLPDEAQWPASWTNLERAKYLSAEPGGGARVFKFVGFGHYGERVLSRESQVAQEGFGPAPRPESEGFVSYPWIAGRPMVASDLRPDVLTRLAAYCAFRARAFARELPSVSPLQEMADHNASELGLEAPRQLRLERPVVADGRMQPHEWLRTPDGCMVKTDSGSHGDDHFFPGVTDIAWDLAGAIVEWDMSRGQAEAFLHAYHRAGGDDAGPRIADFIMAYAIFRCAYCRMAASAVHDGEERMRLERAATRYQDMLAQASSGTVLTSTP